MTTAFMCLPNSRLQRLEKEEAERQRKKGGATLGIQGAQDESGLLAAARAEIGALRAEIATLRSANNVGAGQDA